MSSPKAASESGDPQAIDTRVVRKLADILKDTGLTEIEVESGGLKIRVARELTVQHMAAPVTHPVAATPVAAPVAAPVEAAPTAPA
ncbi:MAG TPA: acetyl-CoA carboxylase, biotin carboxyl carrier protein, partial [Caulobacter sp.]|nr:acetyl-CoA carboxylase, biotin carboxyl carrier protein [Caulobacter sp.]